MQNSARVPPIADLDAFITKMTGDDSKIGERNKRGGISGNLLPLLYYLLYGCIYDHDSETMFEDSLYYDLRFIRPAA